MRKGDVLESKTEPTRVLNDDARKTLDKTFMDFKRGIVLDIRIGKRIEAVTQNGKYLGDALLIATGATPKKVGVLGEGRLYGKGVSYCATRDAFFYKGREVVVIGGGNTAMTDALYLDSIGAKATVIHRRESFKAGKRLVDSVAERKMPMLLNSVVTEIKGEKNVESIVDKEMRTSIPRIYAAGDVTGGVRQIVTGTGTGAIAALTIFNDMTSGEWKKRKG